MNVEENAQQKLVTLRKRLDQFGYLQPLDLNAIPLVERIFTDLVHTSETLKEYKTKYLRSTEEIANLEELVSPYKKENAALVNEANQLSRQLLEARESAEETIQELKRAIKKLESENGDLCFINAQCVDKIKKLEAETQQKSCEILKSQDKSVKATLIGPPEGKHARMTLTESLGPPSSSDSLHRPEGRLVDLVQAYDLRIRQLEESNSSIYQTLELAEEAIQSLTEKVRVRDMEITRLTALLQGGQPPESVVESAQRVDREKEVAHLNQQLNFLLKENEELQVRIAQGNGHTSPKAMRTRTKTPPKSPRMEEPADFQHKLAHDRKVQELRNNLADVTEDRNNCQKKLTTLEMDKSRLETLCRSLQYNEKQLIREVDRLSKLRDDLEAPVTKDMLDKLEAEKDHFKNEVKKLRSIIASKELKSAPAKPCPHREAAVSRKPDCSNCARLTLELEKLETVRGRLEAEVTRLSLDKSRCEERIINLQDENTVLKRAKEELNLHYDKVVEQLTELRRSSGGARRQADLQDQLALTTAKLQLVDSTLKELVNSCTEKSLADNALVSQIKEVLQKLESQGGNLQHSFLSRDPNLYEGVLENLQQQLGEKNQENRQLREELYACRTQLHEVNLRLDLQMAELVQLRELNHTLESHCGELQRNLSSQPQNPEELKLTIAALEDELNEVMTENQRKAEEVSCLQQELQRLATRSQDLDFSQEASAHHNQALMQQVASLAQQNKALSKLLESAKKDQEELKNQIRDYITRVTQVEELLQQKEAERSRLVQDFHQLSLANGHLETHSRQLESETAVELAAQQTELAACQATIQALEESVEQHLAREAETRGEMEQVSQTLESLQTELSFQQHRAAQLQAEVESLQLEAGDNSRLQARLDSQTAKVLQLEQQVEELQHSARELHSQLYREKHCGVELEAQLRSCREKAFQSQLSLQEAEARAGLLQTSLEEARSRITQQAEEGSLYLRKVTDLQLQNEALQRQVVNERYERERANQELRHLQPPSADRQSLASHLFTPSPTSASPSPDDSLAPPPS